MEKINFVNGQAPAINGTNLNQLQTNVETAINGVDTKTGDLSTLSTTDKTSAVNAINEVKKETTNLKKKVGIIAKTIVAGTTETFTVGNRAGYLVTTTSNSSAIRGCWLVLTSSSAGTVVNLGGIGSSIAVSSNNTTLSVANNGSYNCGVYITEIANDAGGYL